MENTELERLIGMVVEKFDCAGEKSFRPCDQVTEGIVEKLRTAGLLVEAYHDPDSDNAWMIEADETFDNDELNNIFEVVPTLSAAMYLIREAISKLSAGDQVTVLNGMLNSQGALTVNDLPEMLAVEIESLS